MDSNNNSMDDTDAEIIQFNLTDPDELSQQLEAANLNDEETELLLHEALKINAQLKETLKQQRQVGSGWSGDQIQPVKLYRELSHHGQYLLSEEPLVHITPQRATSLPPLPGRTGAKAPERPLCKCCKVKSSSEVATLPGQFGNCEQQGKDGKGLAKRSNVDDRPAWDDRFPYS